MKRPLLWLSVSGVTASLLAGCATFPTGPSVLVLPGAGRSFEQFQADEMSCRGYADYQSGGQSAQAAANQSAVNSAAVGTVVGALAGAAIGGGRGAGIGAGSGLLVGGAAGAGAGQASGYELQRRYDYAYIQCMYAKGNRVPISGRMNDGGRLGPYPSAMPMPESGGHSLAPRDESAMPPPPPPGAPPPPPPGVPVR